MPHLAISLPASLSSDDGTFDESWTHEIDLYSFGGMVTFMHEIRVEDLTGAFDSSVVERISIWNTINADQDPAEMYGVIDGIDEGDDQSANTEECVARWNLPENDGCFQR